MTQASIATSAVVGAPRLLMRLEGLAALTAMAFLVARFDLAEALGVNWIVLALIFFAPDLSMAGYLAGPRIGGAVYNAAHTYVAPFLLAALGCALPSTVALALAALWVGHIGLDRLLGYGLKYSTGFGDTHLGRIGRTAVSPPAPSGDRTRP
jgi:hypothetical protein